MKFLFKSFGYLLVLFLLILLSVVALVRFRPDWLVTGVNQVQDLARVDAQGLAVSFAPFTLSVADLHAAGLLKSGLAVGAAISTGGASVLAEGLAKRVLNVGSACDAARNPQTASVPPEG